MQNRWSSTEAEQYLQFYATKKIDSNLALRVYTSRLLGQDPRLVLHGGGNTSVKITMLDLLKQPTEVLCIKGSGWDLEFIEPEGLPAVKLLPLLKLRDLTVLSDEDMVNYQRIHLLDAAAPNPSIETLLHAFIPKTFIDHTHANAILSITNQPNGAELVEKIFGARVGIVPYLKPGFDLAKKAAEIYEQHPAVEGLILLKHGIFSFGDTAKESYDRMIDLVDCAEKYIATHSKKSTPRVIKTAVSFAEIAPIIRGLCSEKKSVHQFKAPMLHFRSNEKIMAYVNGENLNAYSQRGVVTPDHIIRTKNYPLILTIPNKLTEFKNSAQITLTHYIERYQHYFNTHNSSSKIMLDPLPRVILIPGLGLIGLGKSSFEAKIVADLAEATIETILEAENIGYFSPLSEAELFEMEYWSLEQAKLVKNREKPFARKVVVITGGAGIIGRATAQAFRREGAEVFILDINQTPLNAIEKECDVKSLLCDVTCAEMVNAAFTRICEQVGGVDIVVLNAGKAITGSLLELTAAQIQESFQVNFYAHHYVAQAALKIMLKQNTGGALLFNVSKQAINPGENFGAYGVAKSATLALARQYALEYGKFGIRANIVNADRIRSGILTDAMIASRAQSRGLSEADYMTGNLLNLEVTADDVAQAFVSQALAEKTTANIMTVDGGNIAAAVR